jgi:hypothetical protein
MFCCVAVGIHPRGKEPKFSLGEFLYTSNLDFRQRKHLDCLDLPINTLFHLGYKVSSQEVRATTSSYLMVNGERFTVVG